jgi:hypothetical protein
LTSVSAPASRFRTFTAEAGGEAFGVRDLDDLLFREPPEEVGREEERGELGLGMAGGEVDDQAF